MGGVKNAIRQRMTSPYVSVSDNFVLDFSVSKAVATSAPKNATLEGTLLYKFPTTVVEESFEATWDSDEQHYDVVSTSISATISDSEKIKVTYDDEVYMLYNDSSESHLDVDEDSTTTYEFDFSIADTNDIYVTWYDADTTQDSVVSGIATLKTEDGTLGTSIFAAALEDDDGNTAFISSETNFIADVSGSQTLSPGSLAIIGILEAEENGDGVGRVVKDSIRGTIRETIMATINDVTYTFNRTLAIANFQLTYDPTRANDYYPNIVYQTPRGDKLTVSINNNNMRNYTFELTE